MSFFSDIAPIAGTIIGGALGGPVGAMIGGTIGGGISQQSSAKDAINAQKEANAQNIAFQQQTNAQSIELADTAHQREVSDLKLAGLNPILSAGGSGAYTPSLTSPQVDSLAPTILSNAQQGMDRQKVNIAVAQGLADIKATQSQAQLNSALTTKAHADANLANTSALGSATDTARKLANLPADVQASAVRDYEERRRVNRPDWQKNLGIDVQDSVGSVINPVIKLFK